MSISKILGAVALVVTLVVLIAIVIYYSANVRTQNIVNSVDRTTRTSTALDTENNSQTMQPQLNDVEP